MPFFEMLRDHGLSMRHSWSSHPTKLVPMMDIILLSRKSCCAKQRMHIYHLLSVSAAAINPDDLSMTLITTPGRLQDLHHRMHVEYGEHLFSKLAPRSPDQYSADTATSLTGPPSITATVPSTKSVVPSLTTSIKLPSPTQTGSSNEATGSFQISKIDTTILPPDSSFAQLVPALDAKAVELKCLNCTATGAVSIKAAGFSIDSGDEAIEEFFENGYLLFSVNKVQANVELGLNLLPGFKVLKVQVPMPEIPIEAITVRDFLCHFTRQMH